MNSELAWTASVIQNYFRITFRYKDPLPPHKPTSLSFTSSSLCVTGFSSLTLFEIDYLQKHLSSPGRTAAEPLQAGPQSVCHARLFCSLSSSARLQVLHLPMFNPLLSTTEVLCVILHCICHSSRNEGVERGSKRERSSKGGMKTVTITATCSRQKSVSKSSVCREKIILIKNSFQSLVPYRTGNSWSLWAGWGTLLLRSLKFWHCWNCHKPVSVRWWQKQRKSLHFPHFQM